MGKIDTEFELGSGMEVSMPKGIVIAASAVAIEALQRDVPGTQLEGVEFVALDTDERLPDNVASSARLLVLEVDPGNRESTRRVGQIRAQRPDLPLIAALHDTSLTLVRTLVRQGVSDVVSLPFDADELITCILDVSAAKSTVQPSARIAPAITVARSTGGCGTTTIITHLAAHMGPVLGHNQRVCVIDLDLQSGDAASFLGITPTITIGDLLGAGDRLDAEFLRSAAIDTGRGFDLLAAPNVITPLEAVDADALLRLIALVRNNYDFVLIDLPADWTSWALSVALASDRTVFVTDMTIASLRQAKRRIDLLETVGMPASNLRVVVNKVERRLFKTISSKDIKTALNVAVIGSLSTEGSDLSAAQDQGLLITEVKRSSRFGAEVGALAQLLANGEG